MAPPVGSCGQCEFFVPEVRPVVGSAVDGYCHAHPPKIIVYPTPQGKVQAKAMFPPMKREEWCGDFNPPHEMQQ